jgi:hypothetical protein
MDNVLCCAIGQETYVFTERVRGLEGGAARYPLELDKIPSVGFLKQIFTLWHVCCGFADLTF